MLMSRVFLGVAWLSAVLFLLGVVRLKMVVRWVLATFVGACLLLLIAIVVDRVFPMPTNAAADHSKATVHPPFLTLEIDPSSFPVSVPPRSTLFILPLHPYQTFTDAASHLHEFNNTCGEEHWWPTQNEIDSKPANGYEEVRRVAVTNHSQDVVESGKLVFRVLYNDSFGGGCMPPPASTLPQDDIVSIPALDQGKAFEFVVVNQTNRCAWLLAPTKIKVKMASEENATEVPLKLEPSNIPNWASTPFPDTTVKWEGVPIKNPGYGIVRSGAPCQSGNDNKKGARPGTGARN